MGAHEEGCDEEGRGCERTPRGGGTEQDDNADGGACRDKDEGKHQGQEDTRSVDEGQCATHTLPLSTSVILPTTRRRESHTPPRSFPLPSLLQ